MCSPQSVAARASASCDGCNGPPPPPQPIGMSPSGRRQTISGRVHRASFTAGGTLKSFDSGLDLSSPTINHTALLIKEVSWLFFWGLKLWNPTCKSHMIGSGIDNDMPEIVNEWRRDEGMQMKNLWFFNKKKNVKNSYFRMNLLNFITKLQYSYSIPTISPH